MTVVASSLAHPGRPQRPAGIPPWRHSETVQRVIDLAQHHLGMDVTYVSRFADGWQTFPAYAGDPLSFGVNPSGGLALGVTYCAPMVAGDVPHVIPDTALETTVADLPVTRRARIGSYIGIPLHLSDGSLYGSFCCASHSAQPELGERDVQFMSVLAELLIPELDREHHHESNRRAVASVIADEQLAVAFQPVVSLTDGQRIGVEALARFPGTVGSPATLFPAAESVGLSLELEELAAVTAMSLADILRDDEFLSINMSPGSLRGAVALTERFPDLGPERLVFEMTEHHAVDHYDDLQRTLRELQERGIRVAIDDAGAGYASLYHIVQLCPDIIKVDRKLVDGCSTDQARRSVVRGFVELARDIGAMVIGEGIEKPDDLDVLCELGVDAAQGYLLARPTLDYRLIGQGYGTTNLRRRSR